MCGMTTGFNDYDADGKKRRIFLDLVGFIGDTPALNHYLDVLGHTAVSYCHLCRFSRGSKSLLGSRYGSNEAYGMLPNVMRGFFQHMAVRDCGAKAENCRHNGMKPASTPSSDILTQFRATIFNQRGDIPKTNSGFPVVPHVLDPYRACFIAPDHVLTGHIRDCISLALKLLPSRKYRESCEKFMIGFLHDAGLPVQNRLVDHDKKVLFSMCMSELYALSTVAEIALIAGCMHEDKQSGKQSTVSHKSQEAIRLVGSCGRLVSSLWYIPVMEIDGPSKVRSFEYRNGDQHLRTLQILTDSHLKNVRNICHMADADVLLLEDPSCPRQKKLELSKLHYATSIALKTVDKPNLHRLRELVLTTLPMIGYIGRVAELVLEKTHQTLKRAISISNNQDIQLHCMRTAAF